MPNPLTAMLSSPSNAAKPGASAQGDRDSQRPSSFQSVMEEGDSQQVEMAKNPEAPGDETEAVAVLETEFEEVEITVAQNEELQPVATPQPENVQEEAELETPVTPATLVENPAKQSVRPVDPDSTVTPRTETKAAQNSTAPSFAPSAFQMVNERSVRLNEAPSANAKPTDNIAVLSAVGARPKEMPDLSASFEPDRDIPRIVTTQEFAARPPSLPDRATHFVQMHLSATEGTVPQAETTSIHEVEDVQAIREAQTTSQARESAHTAQAPTASARAETARAIAVQMAAAITTRPHSGAIEIALNPEELGRVSIVLNGRDDGLHVAITAERPETLEMMRRHLSVLEAEFRDLGMGNLSLDLGTSSNARHDDANTDDTASFSPLQTDHIAEESLTPVRTGVDGRIDIRI